MKNHKISGIDSYYSKSMYLNDGKIVGHTLDARIEHGQPGADTRMDELVVNLGSCARAVVSTTVEAT